MKLEPRRPGDKVYRYTELVSHWFTYFYYVICHGKNTLERRPNAEARRESALPLVRPAIGGASARPLTRTRHSRTPPEPRHFHSGHSLTQSPPPDTLTCLHDAGDASDCGDLVDADGCSVLVDGDSDGGGKGKSRKDSKFHRYF